MMDFTNMAKQMFDFQKDMFSKMGSFGKESMMFDFQNSPFNFMNSTSFIEKMADYQKATMGMMNVFQSKPINNEYRRIRWK